MIIAAVSIAASFVFLSVFWWSLQRRLEREAYYRYELARQLLARSETPDASILAWVREVEVTEDARRRDGSLKAAFISLFAGVGALIPARSLFRDDAIPGLICIGIGIGLLVWLAATRKKKPAALALLLFAAMPMQAGLRSDVDTIAREEMERLKLPALQIAIARNDEIVYSSAFGFADLEQNVKATTETRFRTASVAKSITATAVMQLAEVGKLDLDAPIQKYCPAFPHPVTARQLLAHTSGIRHYQKRGESGGTEHHFTITDSLKLFKNDPLLFEPGTKYGYSTYGYSVLGCAIEGASNMPFDAYTQSRIFLPAHMPHSGPDHHYLVIPRRAAFYTTLSEAEWNQLPPAAKEIAKPGMILNASMHDTSMKRAGGGLLSTSEDLVRFGLAFMNARIVRRETVNEMWTVQKTPDGAEVISQWGPFGLGWLVRKRGELVEIYTSGGQIGARATMRIYPEKGLVVAMMTNLENADLIPLEERILKLLLD